MKKIFITLAAIATLAACSKSQVAYEQTDVITFTPVAHNITKSMMAGETFTTTEQFSVWAYYNPTTEIAATIDEWVDEYNTADGSSIYLDEKAFAYDTAYSLWAGAENAYFWPKVGSLAFAGYHPITADASYELSATANKMTFENVTNSWVTSETTNDEDLMYFNLTKGYARNNVTAVFKHALSWLTIKVATTEKTLDAGATITVSSVKFTAIEPEGTGTVVNQDPITWALEGTAGEVETVKTPVELDDTPATLKEPLFIPQDMDGNLEITYTITSDDDSEFTETKVIALNTMKSGETTLSKWEAAKHYIYNIVISTEEILIDASVTKWTDVEVPVEVK